MGEPIILNKPDTGKYAKLRSTENLSDYISCLKEFKQDIAILVAAKRGIGQFVNNIIADKWKELGFTAELLQNKSSSYIAVMKNGTVTFEKNENGKDCNYSEDNYNITSTFSGNAEFIKIAIGELNYAINCDGLNFVVVDTVTGNIEDTVCFETGKNNMPCCRLSPDLAVQCSEATNEEKYGFIVEKLRKELNLIPDKRVVAKYNHNIGDFYCLCATVQKTEKIKNLEIILCIELDREEEIAGWFSSLKNSIKLFRITMYESRILSIKSSEVVKYGDIIYRWRNEKIGSYTMNIGESFAQSLSEPRFPVFHKNLYIEKYDIIPGKTIFIIPISGCIKPIPYYFWNFCAEIFKMLGFKVVFNIPKQLEDKFDGTAVYVPLCDAVGFANLCGYVFGMRTGFMDLLSTTTANMTIFSTKHYSPLDEVFNIKNNENRIRTIYIDELDDKYETTFPLNILSKYFGDYYKGVYEMANSLVSLKHNYNLYDSISSKRGKRFVYSNMSNKFNVEISSAQDIEYSFNNTDDILSFKLLNFNRNNVLIDIYLYCQGHLKREYHNMTSNGILFFPDEEGDYCVEVAITDINNKIREQFITEKKSFKIPFKLALTADSFLNDIISKLNETIIFITSRDAHTKPYINDSLKPLEMFTQMGIKTDLKATYRHSFICIIDGGKVVDELVSPDKELSVHYCNDEVDAKIISRGWNCVKSANAPVEININGTEYAVNKRGLNIVVWDKKSQKVVDSVAIDFFKDGSISRV